MRDFESWLSTFRDSLANYNYYVDFPSVIENAEKIKIELNILNALVGSKDIENEFETIVTRYPETLKCIPILIAKREMEIYVEDEEGSFNFRFDNPNYSIEEYKMFMRKTGLFDFIQNRIINNLYDYVLGVESGLSSNARKNRGGKLMVELIERYMKKYNLEYYKEMGIKEIEKRWGLDLSKISNDGKTTKRFDFVVKTPNYVYGIETNFYASGGSKLNETARSYKMLALESKDIQGFKFVWFTDGKGWLSARNNLQETFEAMEHLYNINDVKNGIFETLFI
ncbi:MAG: restriction endonuclease [Bacilli bacterium]|nr:restriction endonuclease [Bacilli bacterium]